MIKVIIFDYSGVLTPTRSFYPYVEENHSQLNLTVEQLYDLLRKDWDKARVNDISSAEYWQNIATALNIDSQKLRRDVILTFPIDDKIIKLLAKLKGRYTTVLLSNQIEDWLKEVIQKNNLKQYFKLILTSYDLKIDKPDKRVFEEIIKRTNTKFDECLLIDDQTKNTSVAAELGMHTIQHEDNDKTLHQLELLGII
jgi:HAD superfamily hydrolase (TIGR01509 family)